VKALQRSIQYFLKHPTLLVKLIILEATFIGCYSLLHHHFDFNSGEMPVWLATLFLLVIVLDIWAVWYKLKSIRYEASFGHAVLPDNLILWIFFCVIRVAVFASILIGVMPVIFGVSLSETSINIILILVGMKEIFVLALLVSNSKSRKKQRVQPVSLLVFIADAIIILTAEYSLIMIESLFDKPLLDVSLNPIYLIITMIFVGLFFLMFFVPFRILYYLDTNEESVVGQRVDLAAIGLVLLMQAPFLFYSSNAASEHFKLVLESRPDEFVFVYDNAVRLKTRDHKLLCDTTQLTEIKYHTEYAGYLPPCVYALPNLSVLDLAGNQFESISVNDSRLLESLNLQDNKIRRLSDLGYFDKKGRSNLEVLNVSGNTIKVADFEYLQYFPVLRVLDLSGNPISTIKFPRGRSFAQLKTLILTDTHLNEADFRWLKHRLPNTDITFSSVMGGR
jgi:hypothetical protein